MPMSMNGALKNTDGHYHLKPSFVMFQL